jgi:NADPH:quinone reductase-like Zn-dependent oxidoreductase
VKAIVLSAYGSADNFEQALLPVPEVRPGEVRIKVTAISFNPVDCQIRRGQPESHAARSMILGRDLSGTVDAAHEGVTGLRVGDDVFGNVCNLASSGAYAEYVSLPAELVAKKPASLTHLHAAAMPVAGVTAALAIAKANASGKTSMFIAGGAGGVGSFAIQLARQRGVRKLVTTAGSANSRHYLIEHCGLRSSQIVNYKDAGFMEQAISRNGGKFDIALDFVGGRMLSACCALLAVDGHLASVTDAPGRDDFELLFQKNASFHSVGAHAYSLSEDRAAWGKYRELLDQLLRHFDGGALALPRITHVGKLSPEVVRYAHALLDSNAVQGKLVMTC